MPPRPFCLPTRRDCKDHRDTRCDSHRPPGGTQVACTPKRLWHAGAAAILMAGIQGIVSCESPALRQDRPGPSLELTIVLEPDPPRLPEDRRMHVRATLTNVSRRFVNLLFNSSQRIELELYDPAGRLLHRWSDDQAINHSPSNLAVNPGEKVVFDLQFPTRAMVPGAPHRVTVSVPGHDRVRATQVVVPQV